MTIPSWIDCKELVGGNTEEDVLKRGFQLVAPKKGMQVAVGSFSPAKGIKDCNLIMQILEKEAPFAHILNVSLLTVPHSSVAV